MALETSLINVCADKRDMEQEIARLKKDIDQQGDLKDRLRRKEEEVTFYEESLEVIRKDMENLNDVIYAKNKEYIVLNQELDSIKRQNSSLED